MSDKDLTVAKVPLVANINSDASIEELTAEIQYYMVQMGQNAIEIGKRLIVAKEKLLHGQWQNWLEGNFNLSQMTANRFMRVAERFGKINIDVNFSSTQMVMMLDLPEAETEKFIEQKAAEGTPVEKMKIRTLRAEVKKYNEDLATEKNEEVKVIESLPEMPSAEDLTESQDKSLGVEVLDVVLDSSKEEVPMKEEKVDKVADKTIEKRVENMAASKSEEVLVGVGVSKESPEKEEVSKGVEDLEKFLTLMTLLKNNNNLRKVVEIYAEKNTQEFEKQLGQLSAFNSELKNCLAVWKKQQDKNMSRKAIIAALEQIALADKLPFEKSKFIRDSVEALGFKSVHNTPTKELLRIFKEVKTL